jgi:hypothetical protein
VNLVHTQHVPQRVEVDIAGLFDGVAHVHAAVAAFEVTLEVAPVERGATWAEHAVVRRDAFLERGGRDDEFECRSGRVGRLQRAVLKGLQLVREQRRPAGRVDADGKLVGIVRGQTDERQHFP